MPGLSLWWLLGGALAIAITVGYTTEQITADVYKGRNADTQHSLDVCNGNTTTLNSTVDRLSAKVKDLGDQSASWQKIAEAAQAALAPATASAKSLSQRILADKRNGNICTDADAFLKEGAGQ
jgi:hypothetical protein